jgi:di/tricarboxylate transporter
VIHRRSFAEQHPILLGLGILFAVAFVITYWPIFVAAGIAYGVYLTARAAVGSHRRRQCVHATIAARADYEHAAIMRGNNWRGTFGRYQPAPWWRA